MTDETQGGLTVTVDADDIRHLMTHGRSVVTKDVGPIEVKIKCDHKMVTQVVTVDRDGDVEGELE